MAEAALAGIRVIEVGNFMAAPFCTLQLADLGADVVKIENPDGGDQVRTTAPFDVTVMVWASVSTVLTWASPILKCTDRSVSSRDISARV